MHPSARRSAGTACVLNHQLHGAPAVIVITCQAVEARKNGDPAFPDLVLGTWSCRSWHIARGDATSGPAVVTTQLFRFGNANGPGVMLVTDGIELADFDKRFARPITGATGVFRLSRGQVMRTNEAVNATGGFNLTMDIETVN